MNHIRLTNCDMARFITNGLKTEIHTVNSMNPDISERLTNKDDLSKLLSIDINGHIKILCKVIENLLDFLTYKTEGIYQAMGYLFPAKDEVEDNQLEEVNI
jgi:hypothetical protein